MSIVSGFIGGWLLKKISSKSALGYFNHQWENRYKKISKERSSYLLKTSHLDGCVETLENKLTSSQQKNLKLRETYSGLRKKSSQVTAMHHYDHKQSLHELNRLREIITIREVRLEQCQKQVTELELAHDLDEEIIEDFKAKYCAMKTEVERMRIAALHKTSASGTLMRKKFKPEKGSNNVFRITSGEESLKEISGIGPITEKKLNQAGILTVQQLAEITPLEREAIQLKGRINWNAWIENAREILRNGHDSNINSNQI